MQHFLWPEGKSKCVTFSYDDGQVHDIRLIQLLDKYQFKGTFNLNTKNVCSLDANFIQGDQLKEVYSNHEIAAHTYHHPFPTKQPHELVWSEFLEDRRELEILSGRIIKGMAYPYGCYDTAVMERVAQSGIIYGRTVKSADNFGLPTNWLEWNPTCHDKCLTPEKVQEFVDLEPRRGTQLFSIWGHSYEFPQQDRWESFEKHLELLASHQNLIWAATNMDVYRYAEAARALEFSVAGGIVRNNSAICVWIQVEDDIVSILPGEEVVLN
jgi:hypothetical protein